MSGRLGPTLHHAVRMRLRRVLESGPPAVARGRGTELHALRIAVKHLRYGLELTQTFVPEAAPALKLLAHLQDKLGALADADAFGRTYAAMLDGIGPDDPRRAGLDALVASALRERERALEAVRALWAGEHREPYAEKLAASISAALGSLSPKPDS